MLRCSLLGSKACAPLSCVLHARRRRHVFLTWSSFHEWQSTTKFRATSFLCPWFLSQWSRWTICAWNMSEFRSITLVDPWPPYLTWFVRTSSWDIIPRNEPSSVAASSLVASFWAWIRRMRQVRMGLRRKMLKSRKKFLIRSKKDFWLVQGKASKFE